MIPLTVAVALTTAEELRFMCDRLDSDDEDQCRWVQWQAELLSHWADTVDNDSAEFPSLALGLREFAHAVSQSIGAAAN